MAVTLLFVLFETMLALSSCSSELGVEKELSLTAFQSDWPLGDPRRCQEQMRQSRLSSKRFEVLPGVGWDNMRNVEAGQVVSYNYTLCKLTDDGQLLIPDNVFTIPIKSSMVETMAELLDHWLNSSSTTADTVNVQAGLSLSSFSVSGSFSYEHQLLKSKQIEDKAVTVRVQLRYHRYEAKLQPDPTLSPEFKRRILSIAENVQLNRTEQARYEGQLLVRDFGTHVLTSITAGAGLVKDDYLSRSWVSDSQTDKTSILATASASFFNIFHMSASYGHQSSKQTSESYEKSTTHSYIRSQGGPMFQASNMTIDDWTQGVDENLVPMDRAGDPLYFLITPTQLPELPIMTVAEVEKIVRESVELYYEQNTIRGCTAMESTNFSPSANFDDGSCHSKPTNLTFGGFYQDCVVSGQFLHQDPCEGLRTVNPKTGGMSCSAPYKPVVLQSGQRNAQTENQRHCRGCGLFHWFTCCDTDYFYSEAVYTTYWCAATGSVPANSGYLFGGLYTSTTDNLVTGFKGCPRTFYARKMFTDLNVCLGDDFEFGSGLSVPFGGFFGCNGGNPLAVDGVRPVGARLRAEASNSLRSFMAQNAGPMSLPSKCPEGYSQHLATNDLGCSIYYCVQTGALSGPNLPPVKRPPFMPKPTVFPLPQDAHVAFNLETHTWVKSVNAERINAQTAWTEISSRQDSLNKATDHLDQQMSPGTAAAISVSSTLGCVAVATLIFVLVRRRQKNRQNSYRRLADETFESPSNYGSTGQASGSMVVNVNA